DAHVLVLELRLAPRATRLLLQRRAGGDAGNKNSDGKRRGAYPPHTHVPSADTGGRASSAPTVELLRRPRRPHRSLVRRHALQPLVDELLHPLSFPGFGRVDVPLRVDGDAVHAVELPRLPAAVAEAGEQLHGVALQHVD